MVMRISLSSQRLRMYSGTSHKRPGTAADGAATSRCTERTKALENMSRKVFERDQNKKPRDTRMSGSRNQSIDRIDGMRNENLCQNGSKQVCFAWFLIASVGGIRDETSGDSRRIKTFRGCLNCCVTRLPRRAPREHCHD